MNIPAAYFRQNVLITGGAGFIGSNLARKLLELDAVVTLVDNFDADSGAKLFNLRGLE